MRSIGVKLFSVITIVMISFTLFLTYRTYSISHEYVHELTDRQAKMALWFDLSIRKYIAKQVRPVMYELVGQKEFIPETMSTSYAARSIFEDVRKEFPDFILKFSSDDPRNPANKAGPEELKVIDYFNKNPKEKTWNGKIIIGGEPYMARFNARRMKESCLLCHGEPADAPVSLLEQYGSTAGFHRPVGEVIALDTIAIPISKVHQHLWSELIRNFMFIGLGLFLLVVVVFVVVRLLVSNRLALITDHFKEAARQIEYSQVEPIEVKGNDEISTLASGFNKLAGKLHRYYVSLETEINERKKVNKQLELEIEEKNRAEQALKESEEIISNFFDQGNIGAVITSLEKRFIRVNQKFQDLLGYSERELKKKTWIEITHPEDLNADLKLFDKLLTGEINNYELDKRFFTKDGSILYSHITASCLRDSVGSPKYIFRTLQDITKQKKLEKELFQSHKIEAIGTLAGGIAHDFNNILSAILGYSEMVKMGIPADSPAQKDVDTVIQSGKRAADLVKQILTFSRKKEHQLQTLTPYPIIKEALQMLRSTLPATIEIVEDIDKECGNIEGDPTNIHQIIVNLCSNALHSMEKQKGILTVKLYRKDLMAEDVEAYDNVSAGSFIVLAVSDTGHGMDEQTVQRVFEPYFTTKEIGEGSGIGLSVIHGIVQDYKGFIRVESTPEQGSTFYVYLPVLQEEFSFYEDDEETTLASEAPLAKGGGRILVVDDEKLLVQINKRRLESVGYTVTTTTDSEEALEKIRSFPEQFDLLITDQTMPKMSGADLTREVLKIIPGLPVIMSTGHSEVVTEEKALEMGIRKYVLKPIQGNEFIDAVREVLDEK